MPLPQLLQFTSGTPVQSPDDWEKRRRELAETVLSLEYGGLPPVPAGIAVQPLYFASPKFLAGGKHHQYRIVIESSPQFHFLMELFLPAGEGTPPVIINGDGCWRYLADEIISKVLARNIAVARFNRVELAPDMATEKRDQGIYPLFPDLEFGALSAWAWGFHRCVDALLHLGLTDAAAIAVVGHSRGGKASLLAGATDERIALVSANNSGCGGAGCHKVRGQGSERLADMEKMFPFWFGPEIWQYAGKEEALPFDQHFLKALVAPRPLLTTEALGDLWANPGGTRVTHEATQEVYQFLEAPSAIGLVYREGGHGHRLEDWQVLLEFIQWHFRGIKPSRDFDQKI